MASEFTLSEKQTQAMRLFAGDAQNIMLFGGSRSGKTFLAVRAIMLRAIAAPGSRHGIFRLRYNSVKTAIMMDTFPKVMSLCFPDVSYRLDKTDSYAELDNGSEVWFGGLDDKTRAEKILGKEFATVLLNECSQIPYNVRNIVMTRLAQQASYVAGGQERQLRRKIYYDCNPPSQSHWTYQLFIRGVDPETKQPVDRQRYASMQINPEDNKENLPSDYLDTLDSLPARLRARFKDGKFADVTENALWSIESIEMARASDELPDMQRIIVAVDPSGADDTDNAHNDSIGIVVTGLGTDGRGYVLEDLTVKAGPSTWGRIATAAYDRHAADLIVGEVNYGGAMVGFVVKAAKPGVPFKTVTASRGKCVRAEPISALTDQDKIRFAGTFTELEDELCAMTTAGYIGESSPNRADAMIWGMTELFPGITKVEKKREARVHRPVQAGGGGSNWLGV